MKSRPRLVIPVSIALSIVAVALTVALLVGWIFVILDTGNVTLMVLGIISFSVIMTVVVLFTVFLLREVREVRRQTSFIDSVTHELKSPLAAMRLCAETMGRAGLADDRREELRRMMLEDVERLGAVVDGILAASRSEIEGANRIESLRLDELASAVIDRVVRRRSAARECVRLEAEPLEIQGDQVALETVLGNLLDNALKYSGDDPQVVVRARGDGEFFVLEVQDSGIGIERNDLGRVFNRFYRAPEEAVRSRYGTGLGLYVVATLVRRMGGKVAVDSEGSGKGSRFSVRLPRRAVA